MLEAHANLSFKVIIVGLSMGLYGYDNSFAAPLMQVPLFIIKYQGVALSFSVSLQRGPCNPCDADVCLV